MGQVAFHFNVPDKLDYGCRLLRKVSAAKGRAVVLGSRQMLDELDRHLWTFSSTDFLPHCWVDDSALLAKAPIVLTTDLQQAPFWDFLVNFGGALSGPVDKFDRVIEIVSTDPEDRLQARERWRAYSDKGLLLTRHDLGGVVEK